VIYGYGREIAATGNDFYAHKTGLTPKSLITTLGQCGFSMVFTATSNTDFNLTALCFKQHPTPLQQKMFHLPPP